MKLREEQYFLWLKEDCDLEVKLPSRSMRHYELGLTSRLGLDRWMRCAGVAGVNWCRAPATYVRRYLISDNAISISH